MIRTEEHRQWCETIDGVNIIKEYVEDLEESINHIVEPLVYKTITDNVDNRKQISNELNDISMKFEEITLDFHNLLNGLRAHITKNMEGNV